MTMYLTLDQAALARAQKCFDAMVASNPDQELSHPEQGIYLKRWKRLSADGSGYYAHKLERSDAESELHDHPFDNTTIMLKGEWLEILPDQQSRIVRPGDLIMRRAHDAHRIEITDGPTHSLFFRGPKIREWGFIAADGTWIHNQEFFRQRGYF